MSKYTLRFPFKFYTGAEIPKFEKSIRKYIGGLILNMHRERSRYVFDIEGFSSENAAQNYLPRLWFGMVWVSLNHGIPFSAETV